MEVVVTFTGGDIDRPMVIGAVNNAVHPVPYPLPAHKTQSGIKTNSTPGGNGSNELRFEDAAGQEEVFVHAQKDMNEVIENHHTRTVRGDEAISVGRNSNVEIEGDQELSVLGNEVVLAIVGNRRNLIGVGAGRAWGDTAPARGTASDRPVW